MKTLEQLRALAEGYHAGIKSFGDLPCTDDWVIWGGYDINFAGADYSDSVQPEGLSVNAYKAGWTDNIGEPLHTFTVYGEIK